MPADNYTFTDALRSTNVDTITWLLLTLVRGFCRLWQGDCAAQRPVRPAQPSGRLRAPPFVPSCTGWTEPTFSPEEWTGSAEWRWTWGRSVYRQTSARALSARCCEVGGRSQPAGPRFNSLGQNVSSSQISWLLVVHDEYVGFDWGSHGKTSTQISRQHYYFVVVKLFLVLTYCWLNLSHNNY